MERRNFFKSKEGLKSAEQVDPQPSSSVQESNQESPKEPNQEVKPPETSEHKKKRLQAFQKN